MNYRDFKLFLREINEKSKISFNNFKDFISQLIFFAVAGPKNLVTEDHKLEFMESIDIFMEQNKFHNDEKIFI